MIRHVIKELPWLRQILPDWDGTNGIEVVPLSQAAVALVSEDDHVYVRTETRGIKQTEGPFVFAGPLSEVFRIVSIPDNVKVIVVLRYNGSVVVYEPEAGFIKAKTAKPEVRKMPDILTLHLRQSGVKIAALNALARAGIILLGDLEHRSRFQLLMIPGMTKSSIDEIEEWLGKFELAIGFSIDPALREQYQRRRIAWFRRK